jgi:protein subunit release factor A
MTDHRIDLTLYSLDRIIDGDISQLLASLRENDLEERIKFALERR